MPVAVYSLLIPATSKPVSNTPVCKPTSKTTKNQQRTFRIYREDGDIHVHG